MALIFRHIKHWFISEEQFLKTPVGIFLLGAVIGEAAPNPTDVIHFWLQQYILNHEVSKPLLTTLEIIDWYFLSASYFLILLILSYILHVRKVNTVKRLATIGSVVGVGAAIGIIARFLLS